MDGETLEIFSKLSDAIVKDDWKKALNFLFLTLHRKFVFDNLAIYLVEKTGAVPEAVYARAAGRGRSKEAEASWGEEIANQVVATDKIVVATPVDSDSPDRIAMPYLLGYPLKLPNGGGAIVFVRFGGPEYTSEQMSWAALAAAQTARIMERRFVKDIQTQLELARQRARFQDDFIATISHELHTPLGFIKGYATSLLRSDTVWGPATQHEFLTIIDEESDYLVTLIDSILDSARLQSGNMPMDFQPVRLDRSSGMPSCVSKVAIKIWKSFRKLNRLHQFRAIPFAGAMIILVPQDPANNAPLFRRDQSDSDGTFTLPNVVPGPYTVIAIANGWDLEWANPAVLQPYLKKGETIQVPAGGKVQVKVQVQ